MKSQRLATMILASILVLTLSACVQNKATPEGNLSEIALRGKAVFEKNDCSSCHHLGTEVVYDEAPDLDDPFLASDSLFIKTHLTFAEESKMPPVKLTRDEIRLVSRYVAEIHAATHGTVGTADADAKCPVCYVPVSSKQSESEQLAASFLGEKYYFECQDCLDTFRKAPEAFLELFDQAAVGQL